jgi:hypothetical protein
VITGATASLRGNVGTAAFASAKAGQRSLAQSMGRYLGPKGVHVGIVIVDGVIDLARTRARMPDKPDDFFLKPAEIAEAVHFLAHQDRSAWTFELDLRPYGGALVAASFSADCAIRFLPNNDRSEARHGQCRHPLVQVPDLDSQVGARRPAVEGGQKLVFIPKSKGVLLAPAPALDDLRGIAKGADPKNTHDRDDRV